MAPEDCDDGTARTGNGCYASCGFADGFLLSGTDQGGSDSVMISPEIIVVATSDDQSADQVLADIVAAANANAALQAQGISSTALPNEFVTDGMLDVLSISDPGLQPMRDCKRAARYCASARAIATSTSVTSSAR